MMKSHTRNINQILLSTKILNQLSKCKKQTFQIDESKELFITTLHNHAPLKTKFLRANYANFVPKELTKAIML